MGAFVHLWKTSKPGKKTQQRMRKAVEERRICKSCWMLRKSMERGTITVEVGWYERRERESRRKERGIAEQEKSGTKQEEAVSSEQRSNERTDDGQPHRPHRQPHILSPSRSIRRRRLQRPVRLSGNLRQNDRRRQRLDHNDPLCVGRRLRVDHIRRYQTGRLRPTPRVDKDCYDGHLCRLTLGRARSGVDGHDDRLNPYFRT